MIQFNWRKPARILIWSVAGLVMIRGVASILVPPRAPKFPPAPPIPAAQAQAAGSYAAAFARDWFTFDPGSPMERDARLAPYLASGVDLGTYQLGGKAVAPITGGLALPWRMDPIDETHTVWTVQVATLTRVTENGQPVSKPRLFYLQVPILADATGYAVTGPPLIVPPPSKPVGGAPNQVGDTVPVEQVQATVEGYWKALTAANSGKEVEAYVLPGRPLPQGYGGQMVYQRIDGLTARRQGDKVTVQGTLLLQDSLSKASFQESFRLQLAQRDGRFYINP